MKKGLVGIVLFLFHAISFGQEMRIEEREKNTHTVDAYLLKAEKHKKSDSVYYYYNRAQVIAGKIGYEEGNRKALLRLVDHRKNHEVVFERLRHPLMLIEFLDKFGTKNERGQSRWDLGELYAREGLFEKAIGVLHETERIEINDSHLTSIISLSLVRAYKNASNPSDALIEAHELQDRGNLSLEHAISLYKEKAEIYHDLKAYPEELGAYEKLLEVIAGTKFAYLEDVTWNNIGYTQKYLGKLKDSQRAFKKVIDSKRTVSDDLLGGAYYNLGLNFQNKQRLDSAIIYLDEGASHLRKAKNWEQLGDCYNLQSMVYYQQNDYFNSQRVLNIAFGLANDRNLPKVEARSHEIQSFIYQDLFDYERALESYKKFLSIRDSIAAEERSRERARIFDIYRVEEFEQRLRLIWAEDVRREIDLARLKAEKDAADERYKAKAQEAQAKLEYSQLQAKGALDRLKVQQQRQALINQQNELALVQRDNELKELALEKERLSASEREKEIELLAKQNELQVQIQLREQEEFDNKYRLIFSILAFIVLVLIGILFAYRQLRKRKKQIEAQSAIIAASKVEIEKEKAKSDSLLLNILPVSVAEELKLTGSSKPKLYKEVSVGFTDFAGFTMISEKLSPEELVAKLDSIFLEFDKIVESYGLQRIKTIGDAYMFASGMPIEIEDHADRCVRSGLDMRDFIDKHNRELNSNDLPWNIRIGINTGPVVAGVIGIKKFAYDIWGDTVNLAARMESSGEVGKVNISGQTFAKVKGAFKDEYRGKVHAKNKGDIDMYFVEYK
jgi:adenylate cyclase